MARLLGHVGAAPDIHALGAILYELLTGRPPFQGSTALETLDQVRSQNPVPLRRLNPKLPRDLETIAIKCLEKKPSRRYATAEALAGDLRRWLDGKPITARPVSTLEHAWRWCRRRPAIAALTVTLVLTAIGSLLVLLALLRRSEALRSRSDANYKVASQSLDEIQVVYSQYIDEMETFQSPNSINHHIWKTIEVARSQELELSRRNPQDARSLKRLAEIDHRLARYRAANGKYAEARSLSKEAIDCWEACLAVVPDDRWLRSQLILETTHMMRWLTDSNDTRAHDLGDARARSMLELWDAPHEEYVAAVMTLSLHHREHAGALFLNGELDCARRELEGGSAAAPIWIGCEPWVSHIRH